jgi:hypothetical protein
LIVGINIPWFKEAYGHDLGYTEKFPEETPLFNQNSVIVEKEFAELRDSVNLIRVWLFEGLEGLLTTNSIVSGINVLNFVPNVLKILDLAYKHMFKIYFTLFNHLEFIKD